MNNFDEGQAQDTEYCILYLNKSPEKSEKNQDNFESAIFSSPEENLTVANSQAKPKRLAKHPCSTGLYKNRRTKEIKTRSRDYLVVTFQKYADGQKQTPSMKAQWKDKKQQLQIATRQIPTGHKKKIPHNKHG